MERSCPSCGAPRPEGNRFCGDCGAAFETRCPSCDAVNPASGRFCGDCGSRLWPVQREKAGEGVVPDSASSAQRRQLTVVHVDLQGSTELSSRLDPEEYRDAIRAYTACVTMLIEAGGGVVSDIAGDGILSFFGYPRASEDDAERAVRAGMQITEEVTGIRLDRVGLRARCGIATGLVVVGQDRSIRGFGAHEIFGETPNLAARLQAVAPPAGVVVCETTRRLCGRSFVYRDLQPLVLKGFAEPLRASLIESARDPEERLSASPDGRSTPLLGRGEELDMLARRWEDAASGRGRVVLLTGEPGIGKSRITMALNEMLSGESHAPLRYFCSSHHQNTALHPFANQLERSAGFHRAETVEAKRAKLSGLFPDMSDPLGPALLADLLAIAKEDDDALLSGLAPQERKRRIFGVLLEALERIAAKGPVLLTFEDAHWIDPTSLDMLSAVVERAPTMPLLLLVTGRPEFAPPWPDYAHSSRINLNRLSDEDGARLINGIAGNRRLPAQIVQQILARADGVPLFIEELTKTILESELLVETEAGYELLGPLPALAIPKTLHASLLARLDRLEPVREIAQVGAAFGREFSFALLQRVSRLDTQVLSRALGQLIAAGLLVGRGVPPDSHYFFRHALLREAAYSGMLRSRRVELHAAVAGALQAEFPGIGESEPETLAHHLTEAGQSEKAARLWLKAGRIAARRSANIEAIANIARGIELIQRGAGSARLELDLRFALGPCLIAARGPASTESIANFQRARELCSQLGDPDEYPQVMFWIATASVIRGELVVAAEAVETLTRIAEAREDHAALINARRGASMIALFMGRLLDAEAAGLRALDEFREASEADRAAAAAAGQDGGVAALAVLSWAVWALGRPDEALQRSAAAVERADGIDHAHSRAYAHYYDAVLRALRGEHVEARAAAERCRTISEERGFHHWAGLATAVRAICEAFLAPGRATEGLDEAVEALSAYRRAGYQLGVTALYVLLSRALLSVGDTARALEIVEHGARFAAENSEKLFQAELIRLKAETAARGASKEAREAARRFAAEALRLARAQSAGSIELSSARTLAGICAGTAHAGVALDELRRALDGLGDGSGLAEIAEAREFCQAGAEVPT